MILITSVDEYLGYCISSHLAQSIPLRKELRLIYSNEKKPWLNNFANKGIELCYLDDYMHPNQVSEVMRNVDQMILTLHHSHPDRVEQCKYLCKVAIRSGVRSILFLSHVGAQSPHHHALSDFGVIEDFLVKLGEEEMSYTILRVDWIQQYFHHWAPEVEKTSLLKLPLSQTSTICPVDMTDVCEAVMRLIGSDHEGQIYTLSGSEALTGNKLVQIMSLVTKYKEHRFQQVRLMDTEYYLKDLGHDIWFDERLKKERSMIYRDPLEKELSYRLMAFDPPSRNQIHVFLDYFDWVEKTAGSIPTNEIQSLIHQKPKSIQEFFKENANTFKPKV
ncbi:uncharacterized protein BX663DRAFT_559217 [Cokeromyces recurvatus]|uniref:uncharacterized protein n=1 Tax=Cokeromyces recurvatus TaxID=90255 RepID=UPI002220C9BB|nr:uncharacterized protein BX663DRAFT_559217 [Cokeromyces recurvatus]KAI7904963.1 hypothetical protein BX663DRAFT_559217 [Cokeromyces recurvatus]